MDSSEAVPLVQYHLVQTHDAIQTYNRAIQQLYRVWTGDARDFPFHEVDADWMEAVEDGSKAVTNALLNDIAKEVSKRKKELDASRQEDAAIWDSPAVRDLQHSTIENALSRASNTLADARDAA